MKLAVISFTERGSRLNRKVVEWLKNHGWECEGYAQEKFLDGTEGLFPLKETLQNWTERQFLNCQGLIFIGACGIAVRAVAPWVRDKMTDPAVLVCDEAGDFVIPLLSGHVGGANQLAKELGKALGAVPVITTATDVNGVFAVDLFASGNGCILSDRKLAKEISAAILQGKQVLISSDFPLEGKIPEGLKVVSKDKLSEEGGKVPGIWITWSEEEMPGILKLIPEGIALGIGCRKGILPKTVKEQAERVLGKARIDRRALCCLTSIDLKQEEEGICQLAQEWRLPFITFGAEELDHVPGSFSSSEFVQQVTGVDCVCERSAAAYFHEKGIPWEMLERKKAAHQVTTALAGKKIIIHMEWT